jgi:transcriptional accessory protein Tex/SPT6
VTSVETNLAVETEAGQPAPELAASAAPAHPAKGKSKQKVKVLPKKKIVKVLTVGMETSGTIKRVSDYGAFVDIGVGRDGLLHISEMSTSRVRKVTDVIKEGDEVTVWIKELDREKNRISLTMIPPGTKTIRDLAAGELVTGTVQRLTNYGAFVDIGMDRDAMLHVKEMGDGYVAKPEDVVKVGEEIEARIVSVDARRGRIDLSLKGLRPSQTAQAAVQEIALETADDLEDDSVDLPSPMELAFREALSGQDDGMDDDYYPIERQRRKQKRGRHYRDEQNEIISRTLRYRS